MNTSFKGKGSMPMRRSQRSPVVMPSELINVAHPFYSSPSVHLAMLQDKVRTLAFEAAFRKLVRRDSAVLDLGTGTGILAMLAAKLGARKVYASEIEGFMFRAAQHNISSNGLDKRVHLVACNGERLRLPERVDIIASECLGHFGFDENMVRVVSDAKY